MEKRIWRWLGNPMGYLVSAFCLVLLSVGLSESDAYGQGQAGAPSSAATPVAASVAPKSGVAALYPEGATYVGEERCIACHNVENDQFVHTTHAKVFRQNPKNALERQGCEACHGPGSRHANENYMDKSLIISFTREATKPGEKEGSTKDHAGRSADDINQVCMQCHEGSQRIYWQASAHQGSGVACTDCHNPMAKFSQTGLLKKESISETCYTCHQQQRAEFRKRSHMPLPEGKMSCEDCHNPHGSATKPLLKADTVNQLCYNCHQEKRGPFLWEHAPVRESCLNCHSPHGSNQEKLLVAARPFLCQQCHTHTTHQNNLLTQANTANGGLPDERVIGRGCSTCHAQIHGSNHPSGARLHR